MAWIEQVISDFGRVINLPNLMLGSDGRIRLKIGNNTIFTIAHLENLPISEIQVSKKIPVMHASKDTMEKLLKISHFESTPQSTLQCSMTENHINLTIRIADRSITLSALENSIDFLNSIQSN